MVLATNMKLYLELDFLEKKFLPPKWPKIDQKWDFMKQSNLVIFLHLVYGKRLCYLIYFSTNIISGKILVPEI